MDDYLRHDVMDDIEKLHGGKNVLPWVSDIGDRFEQVMIDYDRLETQYEIGKCLLRVLLILTDGGDVSSDLAREGIDKAKRYLEENDGEYR